MKGTREVDGRRYEFTRTMAGRYSLIFEKMDRTIIFFNLSRNLWGWRYDNNATTQGTARTLKELKNNFL